jgi:hypothetical protein
MPRSRPKKPASRAQRTKEPTAGQFPTLQAFIDYGGHIDIGRIRPIECVAIANDEDNMYVALQRRRGESLIDLLARLDASLKHCLDNEDFIDEINAP